MCTSFVPRYLFSVLLGLSMCFTLAVITGRFLAVCMCLISVCSVCTAVYKNRVVGGLSGLSLAVIIGRFLVVYMRLISVCSVCYRGELASG